MNALLVWVRRKVGALFSKQMAMNASHPPSVQKHLDQDFVLEKCAYFAEVGLWERDAVMPVVRWIENFDENDRPYAVHLLNAFLYFSREMTDALLLGAVADLSRRVARVDDQFERAAAQWNDFLDSVLITYPTGEVPSATDSGYAFARKARQVLELPEERILAPEEVISAIVRLGPRPVLFLDDFLGTGNQFMETWKRDYNLGASFESFERLARKIGFKAYYVPLFAAELGVSRIAREAPDVTVAPAHSLDASYSALDVNSFVWPEDLAPAAPEALERVSLAAGLPDNGGRTPDDWRGFAKLALTVAFEHSVPDATLRLFYWTSDEWTPLVRRT
jgi:hypothetical protein